MLRLCLIITVSFFIYSCRTDYLPEQEKYNNSSAFQLTSKRISLSESKHKEKLITELGKAEANFKVLSKTNVNGRVIDYGNEVSIDTDNVTYIENGPNFHTYTFHLTRAKAPADAPLENLVLSPLTDGTYRELLFTYSLTSSEKQMLENGLPVETKGKVNVTELTKGTYNNGGQLAKTSCNWTERTVWISCSEGLHSGSNFSACRFITHPEEGTPPRAYTVEEYRCLSESDPGPGEGGGGSTGGGSSSSGSGGDDNTPCSGNGVLTDPQQPGITDPNGCTGIPTMPTLPNLADDPCISLKAKSSLPEFQNKVAELSEDAKGLAEVGIVTYNNLPTYSDKSYGGVDSNGSSFVKLNVDWNRAPNITGFMHCHLNILTVPTLRTLTVFSMSDFVALAQLVENSSAPIHELGMYVTSERGTFAIKLTDKQAIIDFAEYIKNNEKDVGKYFEKTITWDMPKPEQIKGLLKLIKNNSGAGIELYESDSNFKNWKRHYLDENNKLKTVKCI